MQKIAKFYKVSFTQFAADWQTAFGESPSRALYDNLKLPQRATVGSAGYDFFSPCDFSLAPGASIQIPTGVRAEIREGWVLQLYPRSGLGFRYRLQLANTVGIIDSDYFYSDNEGHILAKLINGGKGEAIPVRAGQGFMQGLFLPFGITADDCVTASRNGGFGSTTR